MMPLQVSVVPLSGDSVPLDVPRTRLRADDKVAVVCSLPPFRVRLAAAAPRLLSAEIARVPPVTFQEVVVVVVPVSVQVLLPSLA